MKKVLFGTTALVAAGLLVTSVAYADEHEMAEEEMMEEEMMEPEPVSIGFSGSYRNAISVSSADSSPEIRTWLEPVISGSATMDNGLTFGVSAVLEMEGFFDGQGPILGRGVSAYQRHMTIDGAFGGITIGQTSGARRAMTITAPGATSSFGVNFAYLGWRQSENVVTMESGHSNNRDAKIVYRSPTISGIQVGASYAPDGTINDGATADEQIAVAATLTQGLGDISVSANLGYETADKAGNRPTDINAGLSIGMGEISFGGGVRLSDNDSGTEVRQSDVGATLAMGALTVGAQWAATDTTNMYALGAAYPLGEGVAFEAQLDFGDRPAMNADGMPQDDNWVQFLAGVAINF